MGAITTIVVPDAATTPVNHTFTPVKVDGAIASWKEQSSATASGYWTLSVSLRDPISNGQGARVYKSVLTFAMPTTVTEVINGVNVDKIAYVHRATLEILMPESATLQNRKDFRKLLAGIIDNASFKAVVENLENIW